MHPLALTYFNNIRLHREALAQNRACDAATHLRIADMAYADAKRIGVDMFNFGGM